MRVVTDLACLSHLHTSRAPVSTQTNVLKGGDDPESQEGGGATQPEWWYWKSASGETAQGSEGPFTFAEVGCGFLFGRGHARFTVVFFYSF